VLVLLLEHHFLRADNWKVRQEEVAAVVVIMVVVLEKIMEVHLLAVVVDPHTLEDIQIYQCLVHQPSRVAQETNMVRQQITLIHIGEVLDMVQDLIRQLVILEQDQMEIREELLSIIN